MARAIVRSGLSQAPLRFERIDKVIVGLQERQRLLVFDIIFARRFVTFAKSLEFRAVFRRQFDALELDELLESLPGDATFLTYSLKTTQMSLYQLCYLL